MTQMTDAGPVGRLGPPPTRRGDDVDVLHGQAVADPFRWLEQVGADETRAWVDDQNAHTASALSGFPRRDELAARLDVLYRTPRSQLPVHQGGRWLQLRGDGVQDHDVLYLLDRPDEPGRVLLDPNALSSDGTASLGMFQVSRDGRLLAWAQNRSGSSWPTWHVRDIESGVDLPDEIAGAKMGVAWAPDSRGFFYAGYDPVAEDERYERLSLDERMWFHRLGDQQNQDELVFEQPENPSWLFTVAVTEDGRYLVVHTADGTDSRTRILYRDLLDPTGRFVTLTEPDALYRYVGNDGATWYLLTDDEAPRGHVVAVDLDDPERSNWKVVVPEGPAPIAGLMSSVHVVDNRVIRVEGHLAVNRVRLTDLGTGQSRVLKLPTEGSVVVSRPAAGDTELYCEIAGFATPRLLVAGDLETGEARLVGRADSVTPLDLDFEQVLVPSTGGVDVPMLLVRSKQVQRSGEVPTVMFGYGGFNVTWAASFAPWQWLRVWLEAGGMVAWTSLRGGGEFDREWHEAGRRANKQNVFDDFAACARWLHETGWTRPDRTAIHGQSNGGLLVGASVTQQPDLFGAAIAEVGVLDMLRYDKWTSGRWWVSDYGSADDEEQFGWLFAYSPVHNARVGIAYPATMIMAALNDDHVVPGHSFKFAAALQGAQAGDRPVLLRVETHTGHGGGKPASMKVAEATDLLSFLSLALGVDL